MADQQQGSLDTLIASAVYAFVRAAVTAGMEPTRAVNLAAFGIIEGTLGRDAIRSLGIPRPTVSRWRRELAALAESDSVEKLDDPDAELAFVNEMLPMLGFRDLRIHREGGDDERKDT